MDEREDGTDPGTGPPEGMATAASEVFSAPPLFSAAGAGVAAVDPGVDDGDALEGVEEGAEVEADDDGDDGGRKGLSFAAKALVVGAGWVLLVLFLIGQFSDDDDGAEPGPLGIDQAGDAAAGDAVAAGDEGSVAEEPVDLDGDGEIEPGEPGFGSPALGGASADGGVEGGESSSAGASGGGGGSAGGGSGEGSGDEAAPVSLPGGSGGSGSSGGTTTTTTSPATTTANPGGGGGGGGGGSTSTTSPPTTEAPPPEPFAGEIVTISSTCTFDREEVEAATASIVVRFVNSSTSAKTVRYGGDNYTVPASGQLDRTFTADREVSCRMDGDTKDSIRIDVKR